jgi:hypothetical protein
MGYTLFTLSGMVGIMSLRKRHQHIGFSREQKNIMQWQQQPLWGKDEHFRQRTSTGMPAAAKTVRSH